MLDPANMQSRMIKVHLIPTEIRKLTHSESVAIGDQDHGGAPMAPAALAGRLDQLLALDLGQVFAGADLGIRTPSGGDCP